MIKFFKFSAWSLFILLMASLVVAGVLMGVAHEGLAQSGHWTVIVDDQAIASADQARAWMHDDELGVFGAFLALSATVFCLLLVVPLVLLLGVGLPLVCVLLALGAVAVSLLGVAALLSAPLLVPVLLLIWVLRRKPKVAA